MNKTKSKETTTMQGKVVIVTGGNSGLGFESVKALSACGARVIMACRNKQRAQSALNEILSQTSNADIVLMNLDLANLSSIREFSKQFQKENSRLDVLMNNAGLMAIPRKTTVDGFEMQLGTNHLGHFALTGELLDRLLDTPHSRVITVTSLAANTGRVNFKDLASEKKYNRWMAYGQSKLSNMLFGLELQRRLDELGSNTISVLAHPGFSATNLQKGPTEGSGLIGKITAKMLEPLCQPQNQGALPQLYAAMEPKVQGGSYYGPSGLLEIRGRATKVAIPKAGRDSDSAQKLWDQSSILTGTRFSAFLE